MFSRARPQEAIAGRRAIRRRPDAGARDGGQGLRGWDVDTATMVTTPSIVTSDRTATLDATVLRTYQLRVNCVIRPVNCRKQWVGGGDDGDVEHDRAADPSTARDPCDPVRDPA